MNTKQRHTIARQASAPMSLIDRHKAGLTGARTEVAGPDRQLAAMRAHAERRRQLDAQVPFDGRALYVRVDGGRASAATAARMLGWDATTPLDLFVHAGKVIVTRTGPDCPAPRGAGSTLDSSLRLKLKRATRDVLGIADGDEVHMLVDQARDVVIVESAVAVITRTNADLYFPLDVADPALGVAEIGSSAADELTVIDATQELAHAS